jgi:hypothetical protein
MSNGYVARPLCLRGAYRTRAFSLTVESFASSSLRRLRQGNGNGWSAPGPASGYGRPNNGGGGGGWGASAPSYGGGGGMSGGGGAGYGGWKDGKHIQGPKNLRMEKELFGEPEDKVSQVSSRFSHLALNRKAFALFFSLTLEPSRHPPFFLFSSTPESTLTSTSRSPSRLPVETSPSPSPSSPALPSTLS